VPRFDPASLPESVRRLNPHLAAKKKGSAAKPAASSRANGASWEGDVASALGALAAAGDVAHFLRQDARKVERDRRVVGRVPGACDFVGALGDGRAFCVECKGARSGAVYATREHAAAARRARAPAFTGEQRAQLDAYDRCGAAALVAVRLGGRRFLAPWRAVRGAQKLDASGLSAWAWDGGAPRLRERLAVNGARPASVRRAEEDHDGRDHEASGRGRTHGGDPGD